jgi:SAM-dependent methyltransferase
MMDAPDEKFENLISEARSWKMSGWDFSSLEGRWIEEPPPWDLRKIIIKDFSTSDTLLDLGTGGGEFLSSLVPLPRQVYCTEGHRPNVPVARDKLRSLGIEVICTYCDDNDTVPNQRGALPIRSESLDLVIDRHESFKASEVYRVLKRGGRFLTQQVGAGNLAELNTLLGGPVEQTGWDLVECKRQIEAADFEIREAREAKLKSYFKDIGAVACFLLSAPWQIVDFTVDAYLPKLKVLHEKMENEGGLIVTATRFFVRAKKA